MAPIAKSLDVTLGVPLDDTYQERVARFQECLCQHWAGNRFFSSLAPVPETHFFVRVRHYGVTPVKQVRTLETFLKSKTKKVSALYLVPQTLFVSASPQIIFLKMKDLSTNFGVQSGYAKLVQVAEEGARKLGAYGLTGMSNLEIPLFYYRDIKFLKDLKEVVKDKPWVSPKFRQTPFVATHVSLMKKQRAIADMTLTDDYDQLKRFPLK